jgi:hypothetical protein
MPTIIHTGSGPFNALRLKMLNLGQQPAVPHGIPQGAPEGQDFDITTKNQENLD